MSHVLWSNRRRRVSGFAGALLISALLAGCGAGVNAATQRQNPSGDGAYFNSTGLEGRGLVLVEGTALGAANLVGTVVNGNAEDDAITAVQIDQSTAMVLPGPQVALPARSGVQFGYSGDQSRLEVTGLASGRSTFHQVTISFARAGQVEVLVLGVPAEGIWAGLGPLTAPK